MFKEGISSAGAAFQGALHLHTKCQKILKAYLQLLFSKKEIKRKVDTETVKVNA